MLGSSKEDTYFNISPLELGVWEASPCHSRGCQGNSRASVVGGILFYLHQEGGGSVQRRGSEHKGTLMMTDLDYSRCGEGFGGSRKGMFESVRGCMEPCGVRESSGCGSTYLCRLRLTGWRHDIRFILKVT